MTKRTEPIIVGVEHEEAGDGSAPRLTSASVEVLRIANQLTDGPIVVATTEDNPAVDQLGELGVSRVVRTSAASPRLATPTAQLLSAVATSSDVPPVCVLLPPTYWGKEVAGHLSILLGGGAVTDVTELEVAEGRLIASKSALGGSWTTRFELGDGIPAISLSPSSTPAAGREATVATLQDLELDVDNSVTVVTSEPQEGDAGTALTDAEIAVIGGRGTDGDFDMVRELAAELGGAVGATRVACDEGWIDRSVQVGQTGLTISPRVYVGLGVSGAIHHTCGMQGADTIVAICDDPDAPIFEIADFGIVGDVHEIVPGAISRLRELKGQ